MVKIFEDIDFKRDPSGELEKLLSIEEDSLYPLVKLCIFAGSSRKASGITALRISHLSEIASFMIILEGNSRPQNQAIANSVENELSTSISFQPRKQGDASGGWILLDYGSIIVHVMTPQMRNFYKLEKRWKDAEVVNVTAILGELDTLSKSHIQYDENGEDIQVQVASVEVETDPNNSDPFWS